MIPRSGRSTSERDGTDRSLRAERSKTDQEFERRSATIEKSADRAVEQARVRTDEVGAEVQEETDQRLGRGAPLQPQQWAVRIERTQRDALLEKERLTADEKLRDEREERVSVLTDLLRLERQQTNDRLRDERLFADVTWAAKDALLVSIFTQLPTPISITRGPEHVFEFANAPYLELVGRQQVVGSTLRAVFPELEGQPLFGRIDQVFESGKPFLSNEMPVRVDSGPGLGEEERFYNFVYQPLLENENEVKRIITIAFDVTDQVLARRHTKTAVRRAQFLAEATRLLGQSLHLPTTFNALARLALPELADFCVVDLSEDGSTMTRVAIAHGDPVKEQLLRQMQIRFPPTLASTYPAARAIRSGKSELLIEMPPEVIAAATTSPAHADLIRQLGVCSLMVVPMSARGKTIGALSFGFTTPGRRYSSDDLTLAESIADRAAYAVDNARLYDDAQQAIKVREEFLSIAGHELKSPLSALQLQLRTADTLFDRNEHHATLRDRIRKASHVAKRLERIVNELLDVSRVSAGNLQLSRELCDLASIVQDVAAELEAYSTQMGCTVRIAGTTESLGMWDRVRMAQVFRNLLGNAIKYGRGKPVDVSFESRDGWIHITVKDYGIGIRPKDQAAIFRRWQRAVSEKSYSGFGLGLWITQLVVAAAGGKIQVQSTEGEGSAFTVSLPRDTGSE